jgi:hypothetical protein
MTSIKKLSDYLQKIAIEELNEVPERIPDDLEAIRKWLSKQTYLKSRTDDQFLLTFLRGCKFSLEKMKQKLDDYYTVRTVVPEFFNNRDPQDPRIEKLVKIGIILPLPYNDNEPLTVIARMGALDPSMYNLSDFMKVSTLFSDVFFLNIPQSIILGHVTIADLANIKISILSQATPQMIKRITTTIEALPFRVRSIHFVNPPTGFEAVFKLFLSFLSEKIRNRLFVHDSFEKLHNEISKSQLPTEYGGDAGTIEEIADYWHKQMMLARESILENSKYGTVESLRPGLPKTPSTLFGVDGSFRSLNID